MGEKYAVYVVMVEDTESEDMEIGLAYSTVKRIAGDLFEDTAAETVESIPVINTDIAR